MLATMPVPGGTAPGTNEAAGNMNVALPFTSAVGFDRVVPVFSCTVPVGVGLPPAACTVIVTVSACAIATFGAEDTVTVGV